MTLIFFGSFAFATWQTSLILLLLTSRLFSQLTADSLKLNKKISRVASTEQIETGSPIVKPLRFLYMHLQYFKFFIVKILYFFGQMHLDFRTWISAPGFPQNNLQLILQVHLNLQNLKIPAPVDHCFT